MAKRGSMSAYAVSSSSAVAGVGAVVVRYQEWIRVRDRGAGRAADDQYAVAAFGGRIVPVLGRAAGPPSLAHVERVSRPTG